MASLQYRIFKQIIASTMIASLSVFSTSVISVADEVPVLSKEQKKKKVNNNVKTGNTSVISEDPPFEARDPSVTIESDTAIDGMTMLYIGGAIGLVAIGAAALGGGSGSSSDSGGTPSLPDIGPEEPLVGPDLNGSDWSGFLDIKDERATGYQNIMANIVQSGSSVRITTTSTLAYGRHFSGTIRSNGYMLMYDSATGEDWTTHRGNATENRIDLYDFVNNFEDLDRMLLSR